MLHCVSFAHGFRSLVLRSVSDASLDLTCKLIFRFIAQALMIVQYRYRTIVHYCMRYFRMLHCTVKMPSILILCM